MIGKAHCAIADQHDMFAIGHDKTCQLHGIGDIVDRCHGAGQEITAIHDCRIHFHLTVFIQDRTTTGIKNRIIFQ